jgi:flagellar motor switch protein FliN/FliY
MVEPATNGLAKEASVFLELWSNGLSQVLSQITGKPFRLVLTNKGLEEYAAPLETDIWILATAEGAIRGEMALRVPQASCLKFAELFTGEASGTDPDNLAMAKEALLELFRQLAGQVATSAKPPFGDIQLRLETKSAPTWPDAAVAWLRSDEAGLPSLSTELKISAALLAALRSREAARQAPDPLPTEGTLKALMDVQLAVSLRFGRRRMQLREILELRSGTVVELDREIQQPVELLPGEKTIALGDVVLVDGNFGFRVNEVFADSRKHEESYVSSPIN